MSINRLYSSLKPFNASEINKLCLFVSLMFYPFMFRFVRVVKTALTTTRTRYLCDAMTVSIDLMANLLLAAGGRSGISTGGGGSNGELTNWDGTMKKTGWGR